MLGGLMPIKCIQGIGLLFPGHGVHLLSTDKWHYSAHDFIELQFWWGSWNHDVLMATTH